MADILTVPILRCCARSLAEQVDLLGEDDDHAVCDYSRGDGRDEHVLVRVAGEWRRVA